MKRHEQQAFHRYIRGLLLIGFGMLVFKLLMTGQIANFIAPKMHVFMYITVIVTFVLGAFQVMGNERQSSCGCDYHNKADTKLGIMLYALFLFPIVSGFLFANASLDGSIAITRGVTLTGASASSSQQADTTVERLLTDAEESPQPLQDAPPDYYEKLEKDLLGTSHIVVNDNDYISVMDIIGKDVAGFKGKQITFTGFVHREPDLDTNTIIIARYGITCCTADASVLGMMAVGKDVSSLQQGEWIQVTGILEETVYIDTLLPLVSLQTVKRMNTPETPYVYQTF